MATAGDGRAACASGGARDEFRKRLFRPEVNEDPQNVYQEAGKNSTGASEVSTNQGGNLGSISVTVGKSELEHMLEQTTYTRSEAERLIELVHSRIMEESPSPLTRLAASTSGSLKRHKHGDERDKVETQGLIASLHSRVVGEQLASPAELPKHPATMENLPNELLLNILIRLLAKQLAQKRSVSKSWNALLSQSTFIKSHLHCSIHTNDQILLVFNRVSSNFKPFTAHPCQSPHLELTNFIKLPVNPQPECTHGIRVIGAVNGLICSSYGDSSLQIWNPSLSAVLTLPPYSNPSSDDNLIKIGFRFGFDPKTEDYKVVKLMCYGGLYYAVKRWLQVEVFSMRKGLWELIPQRFPSHVKGIRDNEVVCVDGPDGHLHWLGCTGEKMNMETIVAFDLGSETFREIPLPKPTLDYISAYVLGVLSGKLCVMSFVGLGAVEVWVMEEYGVAESWVRRHGFSQFINDAYPYGFTSHGDFLINDNYKFVLYDPIANKTTIFKKLRDEIGNIGKIVEYVDSLVWVAPAEREKVDGAGQN